MSDGNLEWPVPVVTKTADAVRRDYVVTIEDDEVVLVEPRGRRYVLPASSDDQLCDAIHEARRVQQQLGRGLT